MKLAFEISGEFHKLSRKKKLRLVMAGSGFFELQVLQYYQKFETIKTSSSMGPRIRCSNETWQNYPFHIIAKLGEYFF